MASETPNRIRRNTERTEETRRTRGISRDAAASVPQTEARSAGVRGQVRVVTSRVWRRGVSAANEGATKSRRNTRVAFDNQHATRRQLVRFTPPRSRTACLFKNSPSVSSGSPPCSLCTVGCDSPGTGTRMRINIQNAKQARGSGPVLVPSRGTLHTKRRGGRS